MGDLITEVAHIFFETPNMLPPCLNQKTSGKLGKSGCKTPGKSGCKTSGKPDKLGCETSGESDKSGCETPGKLGKLGCNFSDHSNYKSQF